MKNIQSLEIEISKIYINLRKYSTGTGIKKKVDVFGDRFLIVVFLSFIMISFISTALLGEKYEGYGLMLMLAIFGILICAMLYRILFYGIFSAMNFTKIYRNITDNIYNHHSILYENISKQSSIPEIIDEIHTIGNYILRLRKYRFIWKYSMTPTGVFYMHSFVSKEVEFINLILLDLRSDLATRLTEQRQILESAKSEVEKNITGTPELLAVSELQRTRLDRQIEQFEELQRVLVRV